MALGLMLPIGAQAYFAQADVYFTFGGSVAGLATDVGWTSNGSNTLASVSDSSYFTALTGYNFLSHYNAAFATASDCAAGGGLVPGDATNVSLRRYGCRYSGSYGNAFVATPVVDTGPPARARGNITVTDTTLTGTLTLESTGDETGGASGYDYRSYDGTPFGNVWWGVSAGASLQVNLTGIFTGTSWSITGGTMTFNDPGFMCEQGGFGTTLCSSSTAGGGFAANGAHMSWGMDPDGAATGSTQVGEITVRSASGAAVLDTLSGVRASVSVRSTGFNGNLRNIETIAGEFRRGLGSPPAGCSDFLRYDGTRISCGTLIAGRLDISLASQPVPLPAGAVLLCSALGALASLRRRLARG